MFTESDPGPYSILETDETVRHYCSWPHTPAAPPLLTTNSTAPSSPGHYGFYSVPSDLDNEWEYIQRPDPEPLDSCPRTFTGSLLPPNTELEIPCHPPGVGQHDPTAHLETVLLRSHDRRVAVRSES